MGNNEFPKDPLIGEMIALSNRVIMVWTGLEWYLIGGDRLSRTTYQLAVNYLLEGWGQDQPSFEYDLEEMVKNEPEQYYANVFVKRCLNANEVISKA